MIKRQWLDRGPCPKCGSSDANVNHQQGYSFCFSCQTRFGDNVVSMPKQEVKPMTTTGNWGDISDRQISAETAKKYNTKVKVSGNIVTHHLYGYCNERGEQVGLNVLQTKD